jgi:hypothetical protein
MRPLKQVNAYDSIYLLLHLLHALEVHDYHERYFYVSYYVDRLLELKEDGII